MNIKVAAFTVSEKSINTYNMKVEGRMEGRMECQILCPLTFLQKSRGQKIKMDRGKIGSVV